MKKLNSITFGFIILSVGVGIAGCTKSEKRSNQITFGSGNEAVNAFVSAVRQDDNQKILKIFGPEAKELIWSGDPVSDRQRRETFLRAYDERHRLEPQGNNKILVVGSNDWPFPIPLVKENGKWRFDTASGKNEILNRRIGQNELDTIQTMLAIVDAQREYAAKDYNNDGIHQYAQKFMSDPGKKNGLYWETTDGQEQSPLGPLVAEAKQAGYFEKTQSAEPQPYHGYFYRMLTAQGDNAEGGEYSYIVNGKMIGGFAVLAYPAEYGNSGIMSFMVNHTGLVYQKNLGSQTAQTATKIETFNPDETWTVVK